MTTPELVFGLVGPIGVNMDLVQERLSSLLRGVGYRSEILHLTKLMPKFLEGAGEADGAKRTLDQKIQQANDFRSQVKDDSVLAALAVAEIRNCRKALHVENGRAETDELRNEPFPSTAYIIRQLKRPEEVSKLKKVYGEKFVQISVALDKDTRIKNLIAKIADGGPHLTPSKCEEKARKLIEVDDNEASHPNGQRISKIFQLGDVFISGLNEESIKRTMTRFVEAFFGKNSIGPTKDEFGSYIAKAAALRSIDPARQVGAAIVSPEGDIITVGCNEVPKFGGGNYWSDDDNPQRDVEINVESNKVETKRIIFDLLERMEGSFLLPEGRSADDVFSSDEFAKVLDGSRIAGITEYGRMSHAEMSAITDAARLGRAVGGATLYVTTFPCHNCAKHVIGAGIKRVVYIEPYAKSQAEALHGDAISVNEVRENKVTFEHFEGISPRRYRNIFEKDSRRSSDGKLSEWYRGAPSPQILDMSDTYPVFEAAFVASVFKEMTDAGPPLALPENPPREETKDRL